MKYLFYFFIALSAVPSCNKDNVEPICNFEGRWNLEGFDNTLYEFHDGLRYTIYTDSANVFGPRADAIPNPNEYSYDGETLIIDLNFGNISETQPEFKCACNVVELSGQGDVLYREDYDLESCSE